MIICDSQLCEDLHHILLKTETSHQLHFWAPASRPPDDIYMMLCLLNALCIICGTWSCDDQHHILLKTFGPRLALAPGLQTTGGCLHTFHSVALICTRFVQIYKIYKRLFGSLDSVFQAEWPTQTVDSVFASLRGDLALWVRIKHKM